jgi:hypothetical protein
MLAESAHAAGNSALHSAAEKFLLQAPDPHFWNDVQWTSEVSKEQRNHSLAKRASEALARLSGDKAVKSH